MAPTRIFACLAIAVAVSACSSSENSPAGSNSGGSTGAYGGYTGSNGGSTGTGGTSTSNPGSGGETGAGGSNATGGSTGYGGAGGASVGGTTGSSGGAVGTGGLTGAGGATGPGLCGLVVERLVPSPGCSAQNDCYGVPTTSFDGLQSGSVLRLRAMLQGYTGPWTWTVSVVPSHTPSATTSASKSGDTITPTLVDATGSIVDIQLSVPGDYTVTPQAPDSTCKFGDGRPIRVAEPAVPQYLFRATPPSSSRLPTVEKLVSADFDASTQALELGALDPQDVTTLWPTDPSRFPLPAYLRVTSPSLTFAIEGDTSTGPLVANLVPTLSYNVLVLPDQGWAPLLAQGTPDVLSAEATLRVSPGIAVSGRAEDAQHKALGNVRVLLRKDTLPISTVGTSASDGSFSMLTRGGTLSAVIVPPAGQGFAEAHVTDDAGLVLPADATSVAMRMQWAALATGTVKVTVRGADGNPLPGALVHVENSAELPAVGTLHVAVDTSPELAIAATGGARVDGVTDAQGVATLGRVPTGSYHVTVAPPSSGVLAVATRDLMVPAAGLAADVALAPLQMLRGTLTGLDSTLEHAQVSAYDYGVLAPLAMTQAVVAADGTWSLPASPGRPYELVVDVVRGSLKRSFVLATGVTVDQPLATAAVPAPRPWTGVVSGGGKALAGVLVQAFCVVSPSSPCVDATMPVAEGVTAADGTITLSLPSLQGS